MAFKHDKFTDILTFLLSPTTRKWYLISGLKNKIENTYDTKMQHERILPVSKQKKKKINS